MKTGQRTGQWAVTRFLTTHLAASDPPQGQGQAPPELPGQAAPASWGQEGAMWVGAVN